MCQDSSVPYKCVQVCKYVLRLTKSILRTFTKFQHQEIRIYRNMTNQS